MPIFNYSCGFRDISWTKTKSFIFPYLFVNIHISSPLVRPFVKKVHKGHTNLSIGRTKITKVKIMNRFSVRIIFDRKRETVNNPKKEALVHIEVLERETKRKRYISTNVKLLAKQYSANGGLSIKNHPNAIILKSRIFSMYHQIEAFVMSDKCKSFDDVYNWDKKNKPAITFLKFYEDMMNKYATTKWVGQNWQALLTRLEEFGKIVHFEDLTYGNIADFDLYLRKTINSQPTIYKRHQTLKRVIVEANKRKITDLNPYDEFTYKKGKSADPTSLGFEELSLFEAYNPPTKTLQRIKDMYLFQCYTGLAYTDMQSFTKADLVKHEDMILINTSRNKTDVNCIAIFTEEAEKIAKKYDYNLPKMSNSNYNQYLKIVAAGAGITKHITTHTARHTFAMHLLNKGLNIMVLSKAMGHTNTRQTERYARLVTKTVADEMSKLVNAAKTETGNKSLVVA